MPVERVIPDLSILIAILNELVDQSDLKALHNNKLVRHLI
jgi:hypothetical protein